MGLFSTGTLVGVATRGVVLVDTLKKKCKLLTFICPVTTTTAVLVDCLFMSMWMFLKECIITTNKVSFNKSLVFQSHRTGIS